MRSLKLLTGAACLGAMFAVANAPSASAQCYSCATPTVAYSPVVYTQPYDGWYLGKYVGRLGRRLFGPAPVAATYPSYPVTYGAAYPSYYAASYAPTYSTGYSGCGTCGCNPCSCQSSCSTCTQTTMRPVIMQPVNQCTTCYSPSCSGCSSCGVSNTVYESTGSGTCTSCQASTSVGSVDRADYSAPVNPGAAPPPTFRESERPVTPAGETATESTSSWDPSELQLVDPRDKQAKRPTTTVWTAVYKQPTKVAKTTTARKTSTITVSNQSRAKATPPTVWTSGR